MPEFRIPGLKVPESGTKSSRSGTFTALRINVINSLQCRASSSYSIAPSRFSFFITPLPCFSLFSGPIRTSYAPAWECVLQEELQVFSPHALPELR